MDTITSMTLLEGLRDAGNHEAWKRFTERYQPLVFGFARKLGLKETDAQDAAQETVLAFFEAYKAGKYDPAEGRLRSFLFGIAHRKVVDFWRKRLPEIPVADKTDGSAFLGSIEDPRTAEPTWIQEWENRILQACLEEARHRVKPETYRAFVLYVLEGREPSEVARELGISEDAVYVAKHRVTKMIRKIRPEIEKVW